MRIRGSRATDVLSEVHGVVSYKSRDNIALQVSKYREQTMTVLNTLLY